MQVDAIESYAAGKLTRRGFLKRAGILGISASAVSVVLAACGDSDDEGSGSADTQPSGDATAPAAAGGDLRVAIQFGDANTGLDPLNMQDLGTYGVVTQPFEYLVGIAADGFLGATALATAWTPNDTGDVWTFTLREGVTWHDGTPFTSADVAATLDRMVVGGKAVTGVLSEGAEAPCPREQSMGDRAAHALGEQDSAGGSFGLVTHIDVVGIACSRVIE